MLKRGFTVLLAFTCAAGFVFAGGGSEKPAAAPAAGGGAALIGKLEGPAFIRDTAQFPKSFKEAPALAELVKAGKLPEVSKRLPEPPELLVIKPLRETGKYGGNWRRAFTGPADHENGNRINNSDKILTFDYTGNKIMPALAKDWKISPDGKTTTIFLRKGAKWSDGTALTADDFMFWYNDIYMNKQIVPTPFFEFQVNGKNGIMKKVDDFTVAFEFPEPYAFFVYQLAGSTSVGAGFSTRGAFQNWGGCVAPAHYLKQFLPKYSSEAAVNAKAKAEGFDGWVSWLRMKYSWALNPDLPVLTPWKTVSPINTPTWSMERNPYFWAVDTAGNQLPYIDRVTMTLAENAEVANLRAIAGEFDIQERHMHLAKLPIFLENQQKGNYTVHLDPAFNGADCAIHVGNSYVGDPEIMKWLRNKDFRHALSLGVDRAQLNEAVWLGVGKPGSVAPAPDTLYSPGAEWNSKWATFDPDQANKLLDGLGLTKKDGEGFRQRADGKGRLRLELVTVGGQFVEYTKIGEMVKQQWRKIGVDVDVKELERNLAFTRDANNENQLIAWSTDGSEMLLLFPRHVIPVDAAEAHMGYAYAQWYASGGARGTKPDDPEMLRAFELIRKAYASDEAGQIASAKEAWKIIVEQTWSIGTVGQSPAFMGVRLVKNNMGNIPDRQVNAQHMRTPFSSQPATFYFK
ncbi:MAG: ABC transporter substrate-binding protein [Spirochaetales bacterium]|jgi:peptide/nickel transport system substrate-binding protein|nr:ABC transporter substrate-binding protein [Spirochaetales bacterium]